MRDSLGLQSLTINKENLLRLPELRHDIVSARSSDRTIMYAAQALCSLRKLRYNDRYPQKEAYCSKATEAHIRSGSLIVVQAHSGLGTVIAASTLKQGAEGVYELGGNVVRAEYEGKGFGRVMAELRDRYATTYLNPRMLFSHTVTSHSATQKILEQLGYVPTGVTLGDWPDILRTGQRDSGVRFVKIFDPAIKKERRVSVPRSLVPLLQDIAIAAECKRVFSVSATFLQREGSSAMEVDTSELERTGTAYLHPTSCTKADEILKVCSRLFEQGAIHVGVSVPLNGERRAWMAEQLLQKGFLYSNLTFGSEHDVLELQLLRPNHGLSNEKIKRTDSVNALLQRIVNSEKFF